MASYTGEEQRASVAAQSSWEARQQGPGVAKWLGGLAFLAIVVGLVWFRADRLLVTKADDGAAFVTHRVFRGGLQVTVTATGELESANNLDIPCDVAGGSSILWIVEDGKVVEKGEKLVELDQAALEDQISQQTITYEKARSAAVQAEKDHTVAQISVQEYMEGTFKKELQDAESLITIAEENLRSAQNSLEHSQRMFRRGYISSLELESQQFAVQRAQLELDSASTAKEVLEKFTKVKTLEDLNSQVETAKARMQAEGASLELEQARLNRLQEQLEKCVIYAPAAGMVVYANERQRRDDNAPQIAEGAMVRERQAILRLPDLTQMQVKADVHETKVERLSPGMRSRLTIQNVEYEGTVVSIANQPERTSRWSASTAKEYGTFIQIDGEPAGLRPGMTADVEILVADLRDAITIPMTAVVQQSDEFYVWVLEDGVPVRTKLALGISNDTLVEVKDGLAEGQEVLLNPRAVVPEARTGDQVRETPSVEELFGVTADEAPR